MWWNNGTKCQIIWIIYSSSVQQQIKSTLCMWTCNSKENQVFPISQWNDTNFEFLFQNRNDSKQLMALGEFLIEITKRVPMEL